MDTARSTASLRTDGARLWQSLMDLAAIGATPKGGVCRLALTELDRQGLTAFDLRPDGDALRVEALRGPPTTHHLLARRDPRPFTVGLRPPR